MAQNPLPKFPLGTVGASLLLLLLLTVSTTADPLSECSDAEEKASATKYYDSSTVVLGEVVRVLPGTDTTYAVDMEVYCVFKGDPVERTIRVHKAGQIPGKCFSNDLQEGTRYILYMREQGRNGNGDMEYFLNDAYDPGTDAYLDEMTVLCDISVNFPVGLTKATSSVECPVLPDNYKDDCIPPPTLPPMSKTEEPAVAPTPEPPMPPKEEGGSDDKTPVAPSAENDKTAVSPSDPAGQPASPAKSEPKPVPEDNDGTYESVQDGGSAGTSDDGDRDAGAALTWSLALTVLSAVSSAFVIAL